MSTGLAEPPAAPSPTRAPETGLQSNRRRWTLAAALLAGRSDAAWIAHTRRFALMAWALQSTGLVLGMWWAYHVLGWGGYWGWDPVENVALMPWLATTAYLHSSQVQERRGRLKAWNFSLVIVAFLLVIFGTFIVRSGVVPSVHTFAVSAIGPLASFGIRTR